MQIASGTANSQAATGTLPATPQGQQTGNTGEKILPALVQEVITAVNAANASALDEALTLALSPRTAWGALLEYADQTLPATNQESDAAKSLLRALIPQFTDSDATTSAELQKSATSLIDALLAKNLPEFTLVAQKLKTTLAQTNPTLQLGVSTGQQSQNLLAALTSNDFQAAAPIVRELSEKLTSLAQTPANTLAPIAPKDLQILSRLLAPLQELADWETPPELAQTDIQKLRTQVETALSVPAQTLSKPDLQKVLAWLGNGSTLTLPAKVIAQSGNEVQLELSPPANRASSTTASPTPVKLTLSIPEGHPLEAHQPGTTLATVLSRTSTGTELRALPLTDSIYVPAEEVASYIASKTPITPNLADARNILSTISDSPVPPKIVAEYAQVLHHLELQLPHGETLTDSQKNLALRWMLSTPQPGKNLEKLAGLLQYSETKDPETELMDALPKEQREWVSKEMGKQPSRIIRPQDLLAIIERMPPAVNPNPAERDALQHLQRQLQWTSQDQETRHPTERQQVFYFMQGEQIHKGRIQFRKEAGNKQGGASKDETRRFFVETLTPHLGRVRVDFRTKQGKVELDFADASGTAQNAVDIERPSLAQDLESVGLTLGTLAYRMLRSENDLAQKKASQPTAPEYSSRLDLRA